MAAPSPIGLWGRWGVGVCAPGTMAVPGLARRRGLAAQHRVGGNRVREAPSQRAGACQSDSSLGAWLWDRRERAPQASSIALENSGGRFWAVGPSTYAKTAALAVSLLLSALLTAVALRAPDCHWLAWISFLPLFVAVRSLRPPAAALAGGLWGACLYLFWVAGPTPAVDAVAPAIGPAAPAAGPSLWSLAVLIVIPAVYTGLAARFTRTGATAVSAVTTGGTTRKRHWSLSSGTQPGRITVPNILMLALGWVLVEAALHLHQQYRPHGLHQGLVVAAQGEGTHLHWLARLLGYVFAAFVVACVNASLVGILSSARLSMPRLKSFAGLTSCEARTSSQVTSLCGQLWALRQAHPRAPPIQVVVPT